MSMDIRQPPLFGQPLRPPLPLPIPLQFDLEEGKRLQQEGQEAALASRAAMTWTEQAERWLLSRSSPFTADDLVDTVGLPRGSAGPNQNNAVGALVKSWSRRGLIHPIGYKTARRVKSHGRTLRVWSR